MPVSVRKLETTAAKKKGARNKIFIMADFKQKAVFEMFLMCYVQRANDFKWVEHTSSGVLNSQDVVQVLEASRENYSFKSTLKYLTDCSHILTNTQ